MDGQRLDQITRALARGMTRRGAVKGIAVALGLAAAGVAHAPTAAADSWCACTYACGAVGSGHYIQLCKTRCRAKLRHRRGQPRCVLDTSTCGFSSQEICYASFPI
jgi:hypothetical protein